MARIFITGSADGLGNLAARHLAEEGHRVVLHARNESRAQEAFSGVPGAESVVAADLEDMEQTKRLAEKLNSKGTFDAIIHNAGVYRVPGEIIFRVNTLAPYLLTCLVNRPGRLIYLSSGLHMQGKVSKEDFERGSISYSDSKFHVLLLAKIIAQKWPEVFANAVDPGWVPTKMGGPGAPGNLQNGYETQSWLAVSNQREVLVSGRYFYHKREKQSHRGADDPAVQEKFLELCEAATGVKLI